MSITVEQRAGLLAEAILALGKAMTDLARVDNAERLPLVADELYRRYEGEHPGAWVQALSIGLESVGQYVTSRHQVKQED